MRPRLSEVVKARAQRNHRPHIRPLTVSMDSVPTIPSLLRIIQQLEGCKIRVRASCKPYPRQEPPTYHLTLPEPHF
jgi:hypothetical protein